jgi:hypothetical protein
MPATIRTMLGLTAAGAGDTTDANAAARESEYRISNKEFRMLKLRWFIAQVSFLVFISLLPEW